MNLKDKKWITMGIKEINKYYFNKPTNKIAFNKPHGGLWASPYTPNEEFCSAWHQWCHFEMPHWISNCGVSFQLKDDAKICIIDTLYDLKTLHRTGFEATVDIGDVYKVRSLNFEKLSRFYDAIYLTHRGAYETHMGEVGLGGINLYGWDVESILILNIDCILRQEEVVIE